MEIDGVDEERREATIANTIGDDLTSEGEEKPRAFDQNDRRQVFGRYVLNPENAAIGQFEFKQGLRAISSRAFEDQRDLKIRLGQLTGIHIDLDGNIGTLLLCTQGLGRMGVFEGKIFDILNKNAQLGGSVVFSYASISFGHVLPQFNQ